MNKFFTKPFFSTLFIFFVFAAQAQKISLWSLKTNDQAKRAIDIPVNKAAYYSLQLNDLLTAKNQQINIPYPDGSFGDFKIEEVPTLSPKLAAKYPQIKTYKGLNIKNGDVIRLDISPKGFHAMVFSKEGHFFIDPVSRTDKSSYQVYYKKDLAQNIKAQIFEKEEPIIYDQQRFNAARQLAASGTVQRPSGTQLRTYRIAIAATGEYTQFHGGSVVDGLAAIVTTLNRVNGIYERDVAVRMILVENNDDIIFTNPSTDPFNNDDAGDMINELQTQIDAIIGSNNYDIGHGFSTGAGGLAGLGVVCISDAKARGVTGTSSPIGDPFDVDYVTHEIGHQFGASHTFNGVVGSCSGGNRSANSAYEPGSGTTIMAYAGICGSDNIQQNSDAYFHVESLININAYIQLSGGNSCAQITETGNNIPIVEAGTGGFTIPVNTPFQLNGSVTDPDGDIVFTNWEQYDLGAAGSPNTPSGSAPLFRSFIPSLDTFRIFPQLSDILNLTQTQGEILPTETRDLTFKFVARDNQPIAGVDYDEITFSVSDAAGPFTVDDIEGQFQGDSTITITWNVANTNTAPVNSQAVNIYLSTDGGFTFSETLIENTPNDGSETVRLSNVVTTQARIKVAAADNIFFNITNTNFSIFETPSFDLAFDFNKANYCPQDEISITINTEPVLNYKEPINFSISNLPEGLSASFSENNIPPGQSTTLTLVNEVGFVGSLSFKLNANAGDISKEETLATIVQNIPGKPSLLTPSSDQQDVFFLPEITWEDQNILTVYDLEIATDREFTNIVESEDNINGFQYQVKNELAGLTQHFVRIRAKNNCGTSEYAITSFTTENIGCDVAVSSNVPVTIPETVSSIQSTLVLKEKGSIVSVNVRNLRGSHSYISDLKISLISPQNTQVVLFDSICAGQNNFDISFSDLAASDNLPCPPIDGQTYLPLESLEAFAGEEINGEWTLLIEDSIDNDGGQLNNWELEFCVRDPQFRPKQPQDLQVSYAGDGKIQLDWNDVEDETSYTVERSIISRTRFEEIVILSQNTTTYVEELPDFQTSYQYRVFATNPIGKSDYSNTVEASLDILNNVNDIKNQIILYPNPASNSINIRNDGKLDIAAIYIRNSLGQLIKQLKGRAQTIDVTSLQSGLYFIQLQIGNEQIVKQVVISN